PSATATVDWPAHHAAKPTMPASGEAPREQGRSLRGGAIPRPWPHSATSWFRVRGPAAGLLQPIVRPPSPALGHSGNRKQPFDFITIAGVDAKYIPNGEIMIGSVNYPDLISGTHVTLGDESQVSPRSQRLGEAARKRLIVHPNSKPPAGYSRLGNL